MRPFSKLCSGPSMTRWNDCISFCIVRLLVPLYCRINDCASRRPRWNLPNIIGRIQFGRWAMSIVKSQIARWAAASLFLSMSSTLSSLGIPLLYPGMYYANQLWRSTTTTTGSFCGDDRFPKDFGRTFMTPCHPPMTFGRTVWNDTLDSCQGSHSVKKRHLLGH